MIVQKEIVLFEYFAALENMPHEEAISHVAATIGSEPETVAGVLEEEAHA